MRRIYDIRPPRFGEILSRPRGDSSRTSASGGLQGSSPNHLTRGADFWFYLRLRARRNTRAAVIAIFFIVYFLWTAIHFKFANAPIVSIGSTSQEAQASTEEEQKALESKLQELEKQIQDYEVNVEETKQQGKTLQGEVKSLESNIKKVNLQVQATDLEIKRLSKRIVQTTDAIDESQTKIAKARAILERSLQIIHEKDQVSLLELFFANGSLSDFFSELSAQDAIQARVRIELDQVKTLRDILKARQEEFIDEKEDQVALLIIQESQRQDLASNKQKKSQLLALTKGKESLYQQLLKQSQKTAAEIRSQLYKLLGGGELKFEEALKYAEFAAAQAGVRPALLLAVLDKESDLGRNVGRCNWKTAMHPKRDHPIFEQITQELGIDPDKMPVSCPIVRDGAYGGAMGIAQFIPSTWMLYYDRIKAVVGRTPNPWSPQDAFLAAAFYLADSGAKSNSREAERQAAAKYYAGRRWRYYLRSYGDRVLALASEYQEQIEILKRTASL